MGFGKQGRFHRHPDQRQNPALYGSWYCRQPADLPVGFLGDLHHELWHPEPEHGSDLLDLADESRLELSVHWTNSSERPGKSRAFSFLSAQVKPVVLAEENRPVNRHFRGQHEEDHSAQGNRFYPALS